MGSRGLAQQDDVAIVVSAQEPERIVVGGPVEIFDAIGFEFRDAMAGRAVYGGNPQGVQAIFANRIADGFAVCGVADLAASARVALDYVHGLQSLEIQNFYDDRAASGGLGLKCDVPTVGRNIDAAAGEERLRELGGGASIHGNFFSHEFSCIESSVNEPFAVRRTHGGLVVGAGGDLFQIAAAGVRAPYI